MSVHHPYKMVRGFGVVTWVAFSTMMVAIFAAWALTFPAVVIGFLSALAIELDHGDMRAIRHLLLFVIMTSGVIGGVAEGIRRLNNKGA